MVLNKGFFSYIVTKNVKSAIIPKVISHRSFLDYVQKATKFWLLGIKICEPQMMLRLDAEVYFVVMLGWCILHDFLFFVE